MGVYLDRFRFQAEPDLAAAQAEMVRRLGSDAGIEGLHWKNGTVEATTMFGPFDRTVVCAVLEETGGQWVDGFGTPMPLEIPAWARKPVNALRWSQRMSIRYAWWAWLFGTALPRGLRR